MWMPRIRIACMLLALCTAGSSALAADAAPAKKKSNDPQAYWDPQAEEQRNKPGQYQIRCPGLPGPVWNAVGVPMGGGPPTRARLAYRIGADKEGQPMVPHPGEAVGYTVCAPQAIESGESLGVVVYISPGQVPADKAMGSPFSGHCNDRRLLCIAATTAGNPTLPAWRNACAVTAVELMRRRYKVDPRRVYVCGVSGGGRVTSYTMLRHPDIFRGACPIVGCNPPDMWIQACHIPGGSVAQFLGNTRLAILEGGADFNRAESLKLHGWFKTRMRHAVYIEQPGLGHAVPADPFLVQVLDFWDQDLIAAAAVQWKAMQKGLENPKKRGQYLDTLIGIRPAMHAKEWGADALKAYQGLAAALAADRKAVADQIAAGAFKEALPALSKLESDWGRIGRETAKDLRLDLKQAQDKARRAGQ